MNPDIYAFDDYRTFLKTRFQELQRQEPGFSQRRLCRVSGFANPGFYNEVIKGRRGLSFHALVKMSVGLRLTPEEIEYLALMVDYNDSREPGEKEAACRRMLILRDRKFFERLESEHPEYFASLDHSQVRAAIRNCDFRGDFEKLAGPLRPSLSAAAVEKIVGDLCDWGLVQRGAYGRYRVVHEFQEPSHKLRKAWDRLNGEWVSSAARALDS
jgi:uncharacterized protein (TIGR02147 family)